jgi:hypothetical protein
VTEITRAAEIVKARERVIAAAAATVHLEDRLEADGEWGIDEKHDAYAELAEAVYALESLGEGEE